MFKIILLPFTIVKWLFKLLWTTVKTLLSIVRGTVGFGFRNIWAIFVGAIAALLAARFIEKHKKA